MRTTLKAAWADRTKRWLLMIVLAGLVARVAIALYLGDSVQPIPPAYDQIYFDDVAKNLLAGNGFSFSRPPWPFIQAGAPTSFVSFAYCLFVAGVYWLFGPHALAVRLIQAVICSLMPWQVYLLTVRILDHGPQTMDHGPQSMDHGPQTTDREPGTVDDGRRREVVALVAAAITAGYAYFAYYSATLMTEGFYLMAVVWSLDLTLRLAERPTLRRWAAWGLAVTLAMLLRQVFMPIAALFFVYVWAKAGRRVKPAHVAMAGGIAAALILPWTVRNYQVFGRFVLLNSQAGQTFWNANHPDLGTVFEGSPMFPIPADLEGANEAELDSALMRLGWENVAADPGRFVRLSLSRLELFFRFWPAPASSTLNNVARTASWAVCLPFMLAGLVLSLRDWRRWVLLYLFVAAYTLLHAITWPGPRYRLPVDLVLAPFAALALVSLARSLLRPVRGTGARQRLG